MDIFIMRLDILIAIVKYVIENGVAIASLAGVAIAVYEVESWKREYTFKRNSELLEDAKVLFYEAENAISFLRCGYILDSDLHDFKFPPEMDEGYVKEKYKYTYTIQKHFDEKLHIFNKLYAIELRFRARFGENSIMAFSAMREKVKELLLAANRYSIKGLNKDENIAIQKIIWKGYNLALKEGDTFGEAISKIIEDFDKLCRDKIKMNK